MITVFYDGQCGLCAKEINHYRNIAPKGHFYWQDIMESSSTLELMGVSLADGLMELHALDNAGNLHKGVDAFLLIWRHIPKWRVLASVVALPLIRPVAGLVYKGFARWRFKRLAHCQLALSLRR